MEPFWCGRVQRGMGLSERVGRLDWRLGCERENDACTEGARGGRWGEVGWEAGHEFALWGLELHTTPSSCSPFAEPRPFKGHNSKESSKKASDHNSPPTPSTR